MSELEVVVAWWRGSSRGGLQGIRCAVIAVRLEWHPTEYEGRWRGPVTRGLLCYAMVHRQWSRLRRHTADACLG